MEAVYRGAAVGKRRMRQDAEVKNGERRRLAQLLVSLGLFLLVFLGRGVFPGQITELITKDADFIAAFQRLGQDIAGDGSFFSALGRLAATAFGLEVAEPENTDAVEQGQEPIPVVLLSQTARHGLAYYRENGLREYSPETEADSTVEPEPEVTAEPEPVVVTAVAQAYSETGEALPSNVSLAYYELGLENTVSPVAGTVTSNFGFRTGPFSGKREFHLALDIGAAEGSDIMAFADGVVRYIGEDNSFGLYLMIDHDNGVSTFYAHCSKLLVQKGDVVTCGQTVALVGHTGSATGPHLHFTLLKDDIRLDPAFYVDP